MGWDFSTEPEFETKLVWMRAFVDAEILPIEALAPRDDATFQRLAAPLKEQVKAQGLWAAHLPPELGGQGFGQVKLALMHEILGRSVYAPTIFGNQAPDSGNAELIALAGTPEQKERWLWPLLDGAIHSGFSMTEPEVAGSDPTLLRTAAVRDGDGWVLDGHKWYTSSGSRATLLVVMAVTNPENPPHQASSMFLVPADAPGVRIVRDIPTMETPDNVGTGFRAGGYGHAEIRYEGVRLTQENLLGEEGAGFALAQKRLGPGRLHHCMRWLGQGQRAFDMMCERAQSRYSHGSLLADKQTIQGWIADSAAELLAARLMTLYAAWKLDNGGLSLARAEISMIKYFGAQVLYDVVDRSLQTHGGLGYSTDLPLEAMYRYARAARIYDGPDEVHRGVVARRLLRGYEAVEVPSEHVPTRRAAAIERFAAMLDESSEL